MQKSNGDSLVVKNTIIYCHCSFYWRPTAAIALSALCCLKCAIACPNQLEVSKLTDWAKASKIETGSINCMFSQLQEICPFISFLGGKQVKCSIRSNPIQKRVCPVSKKRGASSIQISCHKKVLLLWCCFHSTAECQQLKGIKVSCFPVMFNSPTYLKV